MQPKWTSNSVGFSDRANSTNWRSLPPVSKLSVIKNSFGVEFLRSTCPAPHSEPDPKSLLSFSGLIRLPARRRLDPRPLPHSSFLRLRGNCDATIRTLGIAKCAPSDHVAPETVRLAAA